MVTSTVQHRFGWSPVPRRLAAVAIVALSLASACSNATVEEGVAVETTTTAKPPGADESVTPGGTLTIGVEAQPATIDPVSATDSVILAAQAYVYNALYDSLLGFATDGEPNVPELAESVEPNDEFSVWTVTLRSDVKFHDGTPLDADAVVTNFEFRANPDKCKCADRYAGITAAAVDDATVTLTLKSPDAHLPSRVLNDAILAPASLADGHDREASPIGTGPFTLADRQTLAFEKNPDYWKTDESGRELPYLDGIRLTPISDASVRYAALEKGEIDMMESVDGPSITRAEGDENLSVDRIAGGGTTIVVANLKNAPTSDLEVRQALALAIDRDALALSFAEAASDPAYSFFGDADADESSGFPRHDLDEAKKLVESIRTRLGDEALKVEIACPTLPDALALLPVAVNQLNAAGFDASQRTLDIGEYAALILNGGGGWNLACARAPGGSGDPSGLADFLTTTGPTNVAEYSNERMDELFELDKTTMEGEERTKLFEEVGELVATDLPYVPLLSSAVAVISRPAAQGILTVDTRFLTLAETANLWRKDS